MDRGDATNFSQLGTLGIEEEYFIVDSDGRPTAGTDELVYGSEPPEPLEGRLDHELFKFVIEAQTPLITDPADARDALLDMRNALISHAETHGYQIAAAGLHPTARWRELEHAEKPRYRSQLDRIQYPQHRNVTAGLHIHVGVDDADKAVWVSNELRWYLPFLLALSANSPYWNGYDTGLQSARAKIFEALPNTGMPTAFDSFAAFDAFEKTMLETKSIRDRGELWYDVRPHTAHGSVEVRTPDAQTNSDHVLAFVEYVHSLVIELCERYEDGESGHDHRRELLDEQKWRAIRHGREIPFLNQELNGTITIREFLERESDRLGTDALWSIFEAESGAAKQRHLRDSDGVDALCDSLVLHPE